MTRKNLPVHSIVQCSLFATLLTVSAWIQIPGAIPFTLQTTVICVIASLLELRKSLLTITVYIGLGLIGLPVFSGFSGGIGAMLGATGGYIIGFIPMVAVIGIGRKLFADRLIFSILSMILGTFLCYLVGAIWFSVLYVSNGKLLTVSTVLTTCVLPFLLPESIKIAMAAFLIRRLRGLIRCPK